MKHICDYCCWYVNMARGCEAPFQMKERACKEAMKRKDEAEKVKSKQSKQLSSKNENDSSVAKRIENCSNIETTCRECHKTYKAMTTRDYNSEGMYIEYSYCPNCKHQNLVSWHIW